MKIRILGSARKHGISDEDIIHVITHCIERVEIIEDDKKYLYIGYNIAINEIEVITIEKFDDEIIVIHAMKARKSIIHWIEERKHERK